MFFPNHQGLYDVLAIIEASPRPFSVVAKKEIANIPFLKQIFACMKAYMIDREDVRQAMQVIINVTKEVKKGRNYLIFAEGTRSKNGNHVGMFKGGSFKSATKAQCPIVPVALVDSFKPFDTNSIKPVTVQVHFLEPLYYDDYKDMRQRRSPRWCRADPECDRCECMTGCAVCLPDRHGCFHKGFVFIFNACNPVFAQRELLSVF